VAAVADPFDLVKEAAVARPGDTLVFRVGQMDRQHFDELRAKWDALMPDGPKAVFVTAEEMLVYRPEVGTDG
jgi:hypothetical protein